MGDKVICRKNNRAETICYNDFVIPLTNGMVGFIEAFDLHSYNISSKNIRVDFRPEFLEDTEFLDIDLNLEYILTEDQLVKERISNMYYSSGNLFEWGHVITCHLAQGSQYDNILVIDEKMGNKSFQKKWLYTAITRAKEGIVLVVQEVSKMSQYNDVFKKAINKIKESNKKLTIDEVIELNKEKFNLTHGKGKSKKHKGKKKK